MTIETYYNFIKIIEHGNISSAAEELMIAQPSLSLQLKNLEKSLGVTLIERNSKKITLTPAGELFYKNAQIICSVNESMHTELENYIEGKTGTLKISMTPTNPLPILHALFDNFTKTYPSVKLQFHECLSDVIAQDVYSGLSEIGIIRTKIKNPEDFHIIPHSKEELMVIVPKDHPLSSYDTISLKQVVNEPIATTSVITPFITRAFQDIGYEPNIYLETSQRRTAFFWLNHYRNCIAFLFITQEELASEAPDCKLLPVYDYNFSTQRSIIISRNHKLSPVAKAYLNSINIKVEFPDVL